MCAAARIITALRSVSDGGRMTFFHLKLEAAAATLLCV
jgi:hypothetical protein